MGIISILAGIVIVAINPAKQLAQVRNAQRKSDIKQINSALQQYYIDEFEYPGNLTQDSTEICDTGALSTTTDSDIDCSGLVDLTALVPKYITAIPKDPKASTTTGYSILISSGKIGLDATMSELEQDITIGVASGTGGGTLGISGLVAHYKMNDTNGTTVVDTKGHNGTGTYTADENGVIGGALNFDGEDDGIEFSYYSGINFSNPFTISGWLNMDNSYTGGVILGRRNNGPLLYYDGGIGQLVFYLGDNTNNAYSSTNFPTGGWLFFSLIYDGSGYTYYLNDEIINTEQTNGVVENEEGVTLASDFIGWAYFNGSMDDLRIYNKALTEEEIDLIYNDGAGTEAE